MVLSLLDDWCNRITADAEDIKKDVGGRISGILDYTGTERALFI